MTDGLVDRTTDADFARRVAEVIGKVDGGGGREVWRALGQAGLLAELYERRRGAPRLVIARFGALLGALDAGCPAGAVLSTCVQLATVVPVLSEESAGTQAEAAVRRSLRGDAVTALGVTDAGCAGSDLLAMTTSVRVEGDEVVVDGRKRWISAATFADSALVLARHRPGSQIGNFTWVLVPLSAQGVVVEPADTPFFRGAGVGHLAFDGVRLGRDHLVGRLGRGLPGFLRHVGTERLGGALWAVALARRVLNQTRAWLAARQTSGGPLWTNELVRQRFGRCLLEHRKLVALCRGVDGSTVLDGMLLKAAAAQMLDLVLAECAQLRGADGFAAGGVQHLRAEAAMFGIAGGVTELMLAGIADHADTLLAEDVA